MNTKLLLHALAVNFALCPLVAMADCSGGLIKVGNKTACMRKMSPLEIDAAWKHDQAIRRREELQRLRSLERQADQSVADGYDPSVSFPEFRRRLEERSLIQDSIRAVEYGGR